MGARHWGPLEPMPRWGYPLSGGEAYNTHVSSCLSSATAASIAAVIFRIKAILAAGLRSRVAPISSANIISAASIGGAVVCGLHDAVLGTVGEEREGAPVASIDNSNPTKAVLRANLGMDSTSLRPSRRTDDLKERNHPIANWPIGRASGSGANRVHSRRAPARTAVPHLARSRPALARAVSPVPTPPTLGRRRVPGSMPAFLSPWRNLNGR